MKPTLQQKQILSDYLNNVLKYHETVDEVYDHILAALEEKSENLRFQEAVNQILYDDFGGGKGLVKMEKQQLSIATREAVNKVIEYIKTDFKFPNIIYIPILFVSFYYLTEYIVPRTSHMVYGPTIVFLISTILVLLRKFFVGYFTGNTKHSIQDIVIGRLTSFLNFFAGCNMMFLPVIFKSHKLSESHHSIVITCILIVYSLYIFSIFRLSKDEFKKFLTV